METKRTFSAILGRQGRWKWGRHSWSRSWHGPRVIMETVVTCYFPLAEVFTDGAWVWGLGSEILFPPRAPIAVFVLFDGVITCQLASPQSTFQAQKGFESNSFWSLRRLRRVQSTRQQTRSSRRTTPPDVTDAIITAKAITAVFRFSSTMPYFSTSLATTTISVNRVTVPEPTYSTVNFGVDIASKECSPLAGTTT